MKRMITFDNLSNFRDLGGLTGAEGRKIRPGKLFRSGNLYDASPSDLKRLSGMLELAVDFRTDGEILEKPDPEIPGVRLWRLPVMETLTEGVTREKEADAHAFMKFMEDPDGAFRYMEKTYEHIAGSAFALSQQRLLLEELLKPHERGVLWHCTAGKDRTGGFSMILELILGVSREDIFADYLLTNEGNRQVVDGLLQHFLSQPGVDPVKSEPALRAMFEAKEEYIEAFYREAEKIHGTMENFLKEALGVDEDMKNRLREMYLA